MTTNAQRMLDAAAEVLAPGHAVLAALAQAVATGRPQDYRFALQLLGTLPHSTRDAITNGYATRSQRQKASGPRVIKLH